MSITTLNIVGCGKLGQTLARLWNEQQQFHIQGVINAHFESSEQAVNFIGNGAPCRQIDQMPTADCWLIATPDNYISACAEHLAESQLISECTVVFHCSGALSSTELSTLQKKTQQIASIHPIHSFAAPQQSLQQFAGCYCAYEGNTDALTMLMPKFEAIGAQLFAIATAHKTHYHSASVMACNYLVALLDASLSCFEKAGVNRQQAQQLLLPIVHQTVDNTLQFSPEQALTGPIARGDSSTVEQQLKALESDPSLHSLYQLLGRQTLLIAERQKSTGVDLSSLNRLLNQPL